jgi:hypothetical protein
VRRVAGSGTHQQPRPVVGKFLQYQGPGEVDVSAGLAQLLPGPLGRLRIGDVVRAAAPWMADRAVDPGVPGIGPLDPEKYDA